MPGGGSVEFNAPINSIVALAVSMNQQHLALLADTGALWIGSLDLQRKYCEFDTKSKSRPQQFLWCGNGAVVGYWQNILLLVGPENDWLKYPFVPPLIYLMSYGELDGIRIISSLTHELLHCVPQAITDIFKIASLEPGALLMEASKEFRMKSPKADEYLRMVREKNQLELAVTQCIEAAGHELDPQRQKKLLRAASFGKCFLPEISPEPFVTTCRKLRVLNAIRVHTIGLPLTWTQLPRLEHLTIPKLVDRLVRLRHYYLAIKICHYLNIPESRGSSHVLSQWALYKVETCKTNNPGALAKEIADKLGHAPGISYSEIAAHARDLGNPNLAIKLLDYESRASEQVPLLAKLKQDHQAMEKAISSGDSDLGIDSFILLSLSIMYYVMFELGDPVTNFELFDMIRKMPVALTLYLKYCRETDLDRLLRTYYQDDNFAGQALCHWLEAYSTQIVEKRISCLKEAADNYKRAKQDFLSSQTEDHYTLLSHQIKLEAELPAEQFVGLSLQATLAKLLKLGRSKLVESLRREFHVPERRMAWLKVRILTETREWEELGKMAKAKKSPIGFEPFVDAYLTDNNKFEAQKLIPKVKEENKVKYLIKVGMLEEAAKLAFTQKDDLALNKVYQACTNSNRSLAEKVNTMRSQLSSK
ncbi:VPS16 [Cordylochernes scorpioides]|uniref:Vacuolar protein sorting-associated protein 16 homolog n=1 Tax=Cordylochernes scorpioides TaxID=51811 RepID=A0ABY6K1S1_9ARAC|nr:VPS16 [Cordylochernes scorpioides]